MDSRYRLMSHFPQNQLRLLAEVDPLMKFQ
jgi:hypothetical protein